MSRDRILSAQTTNIQMSSSNAPLSFGDSSSMKSSTLNEIWEDLRTGIESVYQQQTMPKTRYMMLYTYEMHFFNFFKNESHEHCLLFVKPLTKRHVYNHCTSSSAKSSASQSQMSIINTKSKKSQTTNNPNEGAQIIGCELYTKLKIFLENFLIDLQKVLFIKLSNEFLLFLTSLLKNKRMVQS